MDNLSFFFDNFAEKKEYEAVVNYDNNCFISDNCLYRALSQAILYSSNKTNRFVCNESSRRYNPYCLYWR